MLHYIKMRNIGPAAELEFKFSKRLNLITGDNGLGKSFLLDIAWWAMTRTWPARVNPSLTVGREVRPLNPGNATISFALDGKSKKAIPYTGTFARLEQAWLGKAGRPLIPGLVLYAMSDGSFAVWDPARNYWQKKGNIDVQERAPAYVFNPSQIWNGISTGSGNEKKYLSQGFLTDVTNWKLKNGQAWELFSQVASLISPADEPLTMGEPRRIDIEETRDIPTINTPLVENLPIVYASAAVKRILALAYCLVWAWQEHIEAAKQLDQEPEKNIIFLIDEIEQHLHPKWQRLITGSLLNVVKTLNKKANVQLFITTHSPLVMSSCEDFFDAAKDKWIDLDLVDGSSLKISDRAFVKQGTADSWLKSEAFDLDSTRSPETAALLARAFALLEQRPLDEAALHSMAEELALSLSQEDDDLFMWRAIYRKLTGRP